MKPIIFSAFTTCMLLCSSNIYAQQNKIIRGHLYEVSYPTQQPKDTMGRPTIYMPDAKSDMDRVVQPGQLPQYVTPLYYGYKEIKHNGSAEANTSQKPSTPRYGEEVSKRTATKNSFAIHHSDGIYHYRDCRKATSMRFTRPTSALEFLIFLRHDASIKMATSHITIITELSMCLIQG